MSNNQILSFIFLSVGLSLFLLCLFALLSNEPQAPSAIGILLIFYAMGAWFFAIGVSTLNQRNQQLFFSLYFLFTIFFPFYGLLATLFFMWFKRFTPLAQENVIDQYQNIVGVVALESSASEVFSKEMMIRQELCTQSYYEIIRGSNRELKKRLIRHIVDDKEYDAIDILQTALNDGDYEVRTFASTALDTISDTIHKRILNLNQQQEESPEDLSLKLQLAEAYMSVTMYNLAGSVASTYYLEIAETIIRETEVLYPESKTMIDWLALAGESARLRNDQDREAQLLYQMLEIRPNDPDTLSKLCDLNFRRRDFKAIRTSALQFLANKPQKHEAREEAIALWANGN